MLCNYFEMKDEGDHMTLFLGFLMLDLAWHMVAMSLNFFHYI